MGDLSETLSDLQKNHQMEEEVEVRCDQLLNVQHLTLNNNADSIPWIMNHIEHFVSHSRGNDSVTEMHLSPQDLYGHDDVVWDKLGQAVGNLQALERLCMCTPVYYDDDEVVPIPEWERNLACILSGVRQRITLINTLYHDEDEDNISAWRADDIRSFARAIHGHPTIIRFEGGEGFPYESVDALYAALATLPALESIRLGTQGVGQGDETVLANPDSFTELLRVPTLRCVYFDHFSFTRALCQAAANALMEGTVITKLQFWNCSFSAEESAAIMASGFTRNTSVVSISVSGPSGGALIGALAAALPSNSTLQDLSLLEGRLVSVVNMSQVFLALGSNTGLKALQVGFSSVGMDAVMDASLCTAIKDGLEWNETLESLEVKSIPLCDENAALWRRAFSFLRTNKAIKFLVVETQSSVITKACLSAFRINIVAMLQENTSLESLSISISPNFPLPLDTRLTDYEDKEMAAFLKKNYAMERIPEIDTGDVGAILRLNEAGRRYLIQDGSSISKGVVVLGRVNNDINCVFLHLLENPRLCDRRAVEMVAAGESNGMSTNPNSSNGGGKRERSSAHEGNESRRRLA
jgi:hypothetical protein